MEGHGKVEPWGTEREGGGYCEPKNMGGTLLLDRSVRQQQGGGRDTIHFVKCGGSFGGPIVGSGTFW